MTHDAHAPRPQPKSVLVLITEDWFVVSHFLPLLRALVALGLDVTVATRCMGKQHLIEATGARVEPFDFRRGAINPWTDTSVVMALRRLIARHRPDAVHAIAMKPIALAALAAVSGTGTATVMHLTGVGMAGITASRRTSLAHASVMRLMRRRLAAINVRLLIENPDDRARICADADIRQTRVTLLGGAGIDPEHFPEQAVPPVSDVSPVRIAYVGRMVWSKGVDVLVEAHRLIRAGGTSVDLVLCGAPDPENPRSIAAASLTGWSAEAGVSWLGFVADVRGVWADAHIAVVPSRGGEGLPRALLEAAGSGRPLIVTDVPGCRHFVRDGVEGLVVPPGDSLALAEAIGQLARDPDLRRRMGRAARARLLDGFTEAHVAASIQGVYRDLLGLTAPI
jgi:glycosyltransferase involved in cell wall biosynthesis